jgi:uncharacterized Zn-finger protein
MEHTECPICFGEIRKDAKKCKHCGEWLQEDFLRSDKTDRDIDDRATCLSCNKKMIPRIILKYDRPRKSVCPYCSTTYRTFPAGWYEKLQYAILAAIVMFYLIVAILGSF